MERNISWGLRLNQVINTLTDWMEQIKIGFGNFQESGVILKELKMKKMIM